MPRLYCAEHGREREADVASHHAFYRQEKEFVLVANGTLTSGPWLCDRCSSQLVAGDPAWLISSFPSHFRDRLYDYDFGYERGYFAMNARDKAAFYGADWPDDSIRHRQGIDHTTPPQVKKPICALDLFQARKPTK
jgi:hypothetical protein